MSNQIVNISYLKTFVSGVLTVNQGSYADSYCPTYEQLTDGTFVVNYVANNNPTSTTNGIKVNGTYADNQLVKREDLTMLYQILQSVTVSTNSTTISCCGGSATLSTTAYFKLRTVKESETTDASKNTSASVTATYSDSKSYTSISGSKITFTKNSINYPTSTSAGARKTTVTGKYSYSSTTKEDTVDIKQNANSVDSSWTNTTQTTTSIGVTDSLSFGAGGGTKNYTVTRYYTQYQAKYDSCGALMDSNSYNTSTTVTPTSYKTSNSAFTCTSNSVTVGAQDSGAEERSGTLTVKWGSFQDTCSLSQSSNAIDDSWTATGDPYTYSYSVTVSPWNDLSCGGGTTYATAKLSWKQDYVKYDSLGTIVSSKTENESSDVTNSTTWSTTRGSISSSGVLTYPASTSTGETRTTVTGKYGTYQDTDYMTQKACGATGYTYQILSVTFASSSIGKCDTTAPAVNVNARSGKTNSDGSTTWYDAKNLSISDYTISYNPSLSQNTSNSERTITATVKYKTAQKTATFTQDAGPCDTESTRTEYDLRVLNLSIDKCSTTASPTVQGCSRTVTSHTDGSADEEGAWSDWSNLSSSDYSLSFNPSIETNETTSSKTYTVTATGKGNYYGITSSAIITQASGPCKEYYFSFDDESILSTTMIELGESDTEFEVTVYSCYGTGANNGTVVGYTYKTNGCMWDSSLQTNDCEQGEKFSVNSGVENGSITFTQNSSGKQIIATFTKNCSCNVNSISVDPSTYTFTSNTDEHKFTVTVSDNGCSKCEGGFKVYNSSGTYVTSGQSSFSLTNTSGTYTIRANDNTAKTDTITVSKYVPTCEVSYDYSEATLSFNAANMGKCDTTSEISNAKITNVKKTNSDCSVSIIDETPQYTVSYNPSGTNETNASRTVKVTLTTTSAYGSMSKTVQVTQKAGPCEVQTGTTTDYKIQVLDATIGSCEKSASPTVQGSSRTGTTYSDGTPTSWGTWSSWSNLSSSNYSISFNPTIGANQTSSQKTYTATVTGKGNYAGKSDTATITQYAGPCDITSITTEYDIQVIASTIEACDTSASPTVQGRSRNNTAHTSSSTVDEGSWSSWSNLSSSNYSLSYSPSIEKNETSEAKTYTVTVTGKGNYAGKSDTATITQDAGPCTPLFTPYYLFGIGTTSDEALSGNDSITQTYAAISETFNIKIASRYYTSETSYTNPSFDGSSNQSWVTMDGNSFVVANNNTTSERTATVTYTQSGSGYKVYVYITQSAGKCTLYALTNHLTIPTSYTTNFVGTNVYSNISGSKVSITHSKDGLHSSDFSYDIIDGGDGSYSVSVSGLTEQTTTSSTISEITLGRVIITQNSGGCSKTIYIGVTQEAVYQEPANPYIVIESFGTDLQPCQTEITDEINGPTVMYYTGETDDEGVELVLGTDYFFDNFDTYTDCSDVNDTRTIEIRAFGNGKYVGLTSEPFSIDQACCFEEEDVSYKLSFNDLTYNAGIEQLEMTSGDADIISGGENDSACTWKCYSDCTVQLKFYNSSSNNITFRLSGYNFSISDREILDGKTLTPGQSVYYTIKTYLATNADTVIELIEE